LPSRSFWLTQKMVKRLLIAGLLVALVQPAFAELQEPKKGLWISVVGEKDVLRNLEAMEEAIHFARKGGFTVLFVQVYRGDRAWFDSEIADASPYQKNRSRTGVDTFGRLIDRAHEAGIEVHAWINALTLSQNKDAPLLEKYGDAILTKDQHGRSAFKGKAADSLDRYYGREDQLFMEPGDPRVREHLVRIVGELAAKYPALDGIHFDYIRYPADPPYIPGSRFNPVGLSYGYGEENVERFRKATGLDPYQLDWKVHDSQLWDAWKRDQVTDLLRQAAQEARRQNPAMQISCAVLPAPDRAYHTACQDWARWIDEGITDFVVLMNYSVDARWVELASRSAMGLTRDPKKVSIGLGAFLLAKKPELLKEEIQRSLDLHPRSVVLFDYASLSELPLKDLFEVSQ